MTRTFRDGHAETRYAADATLGWWGPDRLHPPGGGHRRPGHPAGQGHLVICIFQAESAADAAAVNKQAGVPATDIAEAIDLRPAT